MYCIIRCLSSWISRLTVNDTSSAGLNCSRGGKVKGQPEQAQTTWDIGKSFTHTDYLTAIVGREFAESIRKLWFNL